jgi:hypothetical protein
MERSFRKMVKADDHDFRGFHGLGYALYMRAIKESNAAVRRKLIIEAALQTERASNLKIRQLNVVVDFGEIARLVDADLAIRYHKHAHSVLDDPLMSQLPANRGTLGIKLLMSPGYLGIKSMEEKRALINYQLALDYLAGYRLMGMADEARLKQHDRLLEEARVFDSKGKIHRIYKDQLAILDRLLPEGSSSR